MAAFTVATAGRARVSFTMKVRAVMFRNVDQDSSKELIVLFSAVRIGPQQTPYYAACVYKWSGTAFVRMTDVESRSAALEPLLT